MEIDEKLKLHSQYIQNQREQIANLRSRLERMESMLEYCVSDPMIKWLLQNRSERMDPTIPIFDPGRADFHLARYRFAAERVRALVVADIACGTGYGCEMLKVDGGAQSVTGVDICPDSVRYAAKKHVMDGVRFICTNGEATGLPANSFDAITSFETIEHVESDVELLAEFSRLLKPGGLLICSTPNMWPLEIAPHHVRIYNRDSFTSVLASKFDSIEMYNQNSGTTFQFNRGQEQGIQPTTDSNHEQAECFLALARKKL